MCKHSICIPEPAAQESYISAELIVTRAYSREQNLSIKFGKHILNNNYSYKFIRINFIEYIIN